MFSVITGAFQITAIGPHVKAVTEGRIAGKLAFDVIDHVPVVNPNALKSKNGGGGIKVENGPQTRGEIEFRNVEFNYPTRKDLKVLKGLSCTMKAG